MGSRGPITAELRRAMERYCNFKDENIVKLTEGDFDRICDAIDAVHAQLERDYKVACEVNERQDEQYADMVHKLDRAYEKNRNQRKQLTEVQEALHRRNEGELKARWQKELDRLERENEKLRCQLEKPHVRQQALKLRRTQMQFTDEQQRFIDEHYQLLPKDADGVPIHVGDVMESKGSGLLFGKASFEVRSMRCDECGWEVYDRLGDRYAPSLLRHYHAPTVEDVLTEFAAKLIERGELTNGAAQTIADYAAKLRLAGDAS